jgi:ankyrin repeat protein
MPRKRRREHSAEGPRIHDASERSQARAGSHVLWDHTRQHAPTQRLERRGHDYQHVYTQGYARVQLGDTYVEQQNILRPPHDVSEKTEHDKFMTDLGFNLMDSRLATIGAPHTDTCDWLFNNKGYLRWDDRHFRSSHHGFLWIKGKPGAGKSTLMKHALQHMQSHNQSQSTILSYFFNARGHGLEKTTEGMYRSLLHQVFTRCPRRLPTPLPRYSAAWVSENWPVPILQDWLRQAVLGFGAERKFICYIDALEECDERSIRLAINHFEELGEWADSRAIHLSICFASRHYPSISIRYHETINLDVEDQHHHDIETFVSRELHGERRSRRELRSEILERCSGVFLWAALVVQILNEMVDRGATHSQLLAELIRVPDGVEALLQNIMSDHDSALLPTLLWVLFSETPLTIDQLYIAVMARIGHLHTVLRDMVSTSDSQRRAFILTSSKGLVECTISLQFYDERCPGHVQFIHETVREHLLSGGLASLDTSLTGNVEATGHARIGQFCQEILTTFPLSQEYYSDFTFGWYPLHHMLVHMERGYSDKTFDLRSIDAISQLGWTSMQRFLKPDCGDLINSQATTSVHLLIECHCTKLAEAILQRQLACYPQTSDQTSKTGPRNLNTSSIPFVDVNAVCRGGRNDTALTLAIEIGMTDRVVGLLLECGADPNFAVRPGCLPLRRALYRELDETDPVLSRMLLEHGADPNKAISSNPDRSLLGLTVTWGRERLVDLLLRFGAKVRGHGKESPLCLAVPRSRPSMFQMLLLAGANADERTVAGRTALHVVIMRNENGRFSKVELDQQAVIARILLDAGADIDARNGDRETPTMLAFRLKQYSLAKLLLDRGADPKLPLHIRIARALRSIEDSSSDYDIDRALESARSNDSLIVNTPPGKTIIPSLAELRAQANMNLC